LELRLRGVEKLLLRLKRVRNPDVVSLERVQHFLKEAQANRIEVWLAGVRPDLFEAFNRLKFFDWFPENRVIPHGNEDNSATLTAIARIRQNLPLGKREDTRAELYYLV
jgi:SulP family sulfate permease